MATNLVVDLDHSLIKIDLLQLSLKMAIIKNPLIIFLVPFWLIKGKGYLKDKLVKRVKIDATKLPYHQRVINYIRERQAKGDTIVLATASHHIYAESIARYLRFFDLTLASHKDFNLSSHNKAKVLIEKFGAKNFDYIGDHTRDVPVWEACDLTIIVREFATKNAVKKTKDFNRIFIG
jgi:phosphoserine phosphatase